MKRIEYLSFKNVREFAHSLNLKNKEEWTLYCKNNKLPTNIPKRPSSVYINSGWTNWIDFLNSGNFKYRKNTIYLSFEEARKFVHTLNLKSVTEWQNYYRTGLLPYNIPTSPNISYKNEFISMGDWLGTNFINYKDRKYLPFEEAKKIVHTLNLKSRNEWKIYHKQNNINIPVTSDLIYKNKGWISWQDFLGYKIGFIGEYLSFEEARKFVRTLNLKNENEWKIYHKQNNINNIPIALQQRYKDKWISMKDFLGYEESFYLSFKEAKEFAHSLNLKNKEEWKIYQQNNIIPIPKNPDYTYKNNGWTNWPDFLNLSSKFHPKDKKYLSFEEARKIVRTLNLKSGNDWNFYCKSGLKPKNIPGEIRRVYKDEFISMGDWLGYDIGKFEGFLPFKEARKFVRSLKFKNTTELFNYYKSGLKPKNIPSNPAEHYKNIGWIGFCDFIGVQDRYNIEYLPFIDVKNYVSKLKLTSQKDWENYVKNNIIPKNIPKRPSHIYKNNGWISWPDFLNSGNTAIPREYLLFEEAKKYVHSLNFKNYEEWKKYHRSGLLPYNIPTAPNQSYKNEWTSWPDWLGYLGTYNHKWDLPHLINHLKDLKNEGLKYFSPQILSAIINSKKLDRKIDKKLLDNLLSSAPNSIKREKTIDNIIKSFENISEDEFNTIDFNNNNTTLEIVDIDNIYDVNNNLLIEDPLKELKLLDAKIFTSAMDDVTYNFIINTLRNEFWNIELNNKSNSDFLNNANGPFSSKVKELFLNEKELVKNIKIPNDYKFKKEGKLIEPFMMQKLIAHRLINNQFYGNWSGTGSGKTLSALLAGRVADVKNTLIICNNATVEGWVSSINEYFDNNTIYTKTQLSDSIETKYNIVHKNNIKFKNDGSFNYFILNYESFQSGDQTKFINNLLSKNKIDYIVLDEIQNAKQRSATSSNRRTAIESLLCKSREQNKKLLILAMSATPFINELKEPQKLLELLTGESYDYLDTRSTKNNGMAMHKEIMNNGLRFRPDYKININIKEILAEADINLLKKLTLIEKNDRLEFERLLLPIKLNSIKDKIKSGTLIYTHNVDGEKIPKEIGEFVTALGFKIGYYTGTDKSGLELLKNKQIDVLIGSSPVSTGIDGIQEVCDTLIPIILPWTKGEYEQLIGRMNRTGFLFDKINVFIPQVVVEKDGKIIWSLDKRKLNIIEYKATLADLVMDGIIPEYLLPSSNELMNQAMEALKEWISNLEKNGPSVSNRNTVIPIIPLYEHKTSNLQEYSRLGKISNSETTNKLFTKNKGEKFFEYHSLRNEGIKNWSELPYEYIATKIKNKKHKIIDFGCGTNKFKDCVPHNEVISIDHVAINDYENIIACDMCDIKKHVKNEDAEICIFSLSLWGPNYIDYIKEAFRVLTHSGIIHIAEPIKSYSLEEQTQLLNDLKSIGFSIIGDIEIRDKFFYISAIKL